MANVRSGHRLLLITGREPWILQIPAFSSPSSLRLYIAHKDHQMALENAAQQ